MDHLKKQGRDYRVSNKLELFFILRFNRDIIHFIQMSGVEGRSDEASRQQVRKVVLTGEKWERLQDVLSTLNNNGKPLSMFGGTRLLAESRAILGGPSGYTLEVKFMPDPETGGEWFVDATDGYDLSSEQLPTEGTEGDEKVFLVTKTSKRK